MTDYPEKKLIDTSNLIVEAKLQFEVDIFSHEVAKRITKITNWDDSSIDLCDQKGGLIYRLSFNRLGFTIFYSIFTLEETLMNLISSNNWKLLAKKSNNEYQVQNTNGTVFYIKN